MARTAVSNANDLSRLDSRQIGSTQFSVGTDKDRRYKVDAEVLEIRERQYTHGYEKTASW